MSSDLEVEGFDELMSKIEAMGNLGDDIFDEALKVASIPILNGAIRNAPEGETKRLKEGLKISKVYKKNGDKYVLVGTDEKGKNSPYYAFMVEFGTSKMSARPFLRPAFESNKRQVLDILKTEIAKGIGK